MTKEIVLRRLTSISSKISMKISFNNFKLSQRSTTSSSGKIANSLISVCPTSLFLNLSNILRIPVYRQHRSTTILFRYLQDCTMVTSHQRPSHPRRRYPHWSFVSRRTSRTWTPSSRRNVGSWQPRYWRVHS